MLKNKLSKGILCITIVMMVLMSFSIVAFADSNTIPKTMTVSYTFYGPYDMDLQSVIPPTVNYDHDYYSGTLNYSSYTVKSQMPNPYDYRYYTFNIDVVYSGNVTLNAPPSIFKSQTYNISISCTPDTLESNIITTMGGNTIGYNDGYYSGSLNYSSYTVKSQTPDPYDYGYYTYNIDVVYSGNVTFSAPSSLWKTQTYNMSISCTPDTLESNIITAMGGNTIGYNDGYYSGSLNYSSYTVKSQTADPYDYGYYTFNIAVMYSGMVYH